MTARTIGDLTTAGILLRLDGPVNAPSVHAGQVAGVTEDLTLPANLDLEFGIRNTALDQLGVGINRYRGRRSGGSGTG